MGNWTNAGFEAKTLDFYKTQLQQVFVNAFGDDFLLDDALPQGVVIQEIAEILYGADMDGIEALSRLNLNTATGIYLDLIGNLRGIRRLIGTQASLTVKVTSSATALPFTIPAGTIFTNSSSAETFTAESPITIESATASILLTSTTKGEVKTAINDTMTVNISNITDVTVTAVSQGIRTEEDINYRNRIMDSYVVATGTTQGILNLLSAMDCVKTVGVEYNDTDTQSGGIPPYATEFMVVPVEGYDMDTFQDRVAKVILDNKCPGSPTFGNTPVTATDVFGNQKDVFFTIADERPVQIEVSVSTPETTGVLDLSRINDIKETIANYINSLGIGKDISYARCLTPLVNDSGFDIVSFKIKGIYAQEWTENANYHIETREYAQIKVSDIKIGV